MMQFFVIKSLVQLKSSRITKILSFCNLVMYIIANSHAMTIFGKSCLAYKKLLISVNTTCMWSLVLPCTLAIPSACTCCCHQHMFALGAHINTVLGSSLAMYVIAFNKSAQLVVEVLLLSFYTDICRTCKHNGSHSSNQD
jgi:hypothetical protein